MSQLQWAFILVIFYQVKHYLADFPLQNQYMLQKTRADWSFALPLALHSAIHASATLALCLYLAPRLWWLALLDFATHFVMDRIKSGPRYLGRFSNFKKPGFWNCLGFDQMVHHLTHLYIVWVLVQNWPLPMPR